MIERRHLINSILVALIFTTAATSARQAERQPPQPGPAIRGQSSNRQLEAAAIDEEVTGEAYDHINRGNRLMQDGRFDEAIAQYKAARDKAGRPLRTVSLNLGAAYLEKRDYAAAAAAYREAVSLAPGHMIARFRLADALFASAAYPEAEAEYRKAVDLSPGRENPVAHHFLGLSLYNQRRVEEAIAEYRVAIDQARGNYSEARYNLGVALLARGAYKEAEGEFRLAIEQEKKAWPEAHFNLASALEKQQRFIESAAEYEIYLAQKPDAEDRDRIRAYIEQLRAKNR